MTSETGLPPELLPKPLPELEPPDELELPLEPDDVELLPPALPLLEPAPLDVPPPEPLPLDVVPAPEPPLPFASPWPPSVTARPPSLVSWLGPPIPQIPAQEQSAAPSARDGVNLRRFTMRR
jgi:hypothetical protein